MRSALNFFSMLAFGLMAAAGLVVGTPIANESWPGLAANLPSFDFLSVAAGLSLGLLIGLLRQVSWSGLSRRVSNWVGWHLRRLALLTIAASVVATMLTY